MAHFLRSVLWMLLEKWHEKDAAKNINTQNTYNNYLPQLQVSVKDQVKDCEKVKLKTKHDWVDKVIHWEMCKKLKFDYTNKWYMRNPASVLENDTHKLIWDFNIQMDHLISARWLDLIIISKKKENLQNCVLSYPSWPQNKTERKWKAG